MARSNTRSSQQRRVLTRSKSPAVPSSAPSAGNASAEEQKPRGGRRGAGRRGGGAGAGSGPDNADEDDEVSTLASDGDDNVNSEGDGDGDGDDDNNDDGEDGVEAMEDELEVSGRSTATATRRSTRATRGRGVATAAAKKKKPPPPARKKAQPAKHAGRRRAAQDKAAAVTAARRSARGRRGRAGVQAEENDDDTDDTDDDDADEEEATGSNDEKGESKSPAKSKKEKGSEGDGVLADDSDDAGDEKSKREPKATQATSGRGRRGKKSKEEPKEASDAAEEMDVVADEDDGEKGEAGAVPQEKDEKQVTSDDAGSEGADPQGEKDEKPVASGDESDARKDPEKEDDMQVARDGEVVAGADAKAKDVKQVGSDDDGDADPQGKDETKVASDAEGGAGADPLEDGDTRVTNDDEGDAGADPRGKHEKWVANDNRADEDPREKDKRNDEDVAGGKPQEKAHMKVTGDVERVEQSDGEAGKCEHDPDANNDDEDPRAGAKRQLALEPERPSKRIKGNSEDGNLEECKEGGDGGVIAHSPDNSANAAVSDVNEPSSSDVNEPSLEERKGAESSAEEVMDSEKGEAKATLLEGRPDVSTTDATAPHPIGGAVPPTEAGPMIASEGATEGASGASEEAGRLGEVDAKPAPTHETIAEGDTAKSSLDSKIPRKPARRMSSSGPTTLEPCKRSEAMPIKVPSLELQIADDSPATDINDPGIQQSEPTEVEEIPEADVVCDVKDETLQKDALADPGTKGVASSSAGGTTIDHSIPVILSEIEQQSVKASATSRVGSSSNDGGETRPSEDRWTENDAVPMTSPESKIPLAGKRDAITVGDNHSHDHEFATFTIKMENDESPVSPIGAPASLHRQTDKAVQIELAKKVPLRNEVGVASLPLLSIAFDAADKGEGADASRHEASSGKDSLLKRELKAIRPAANAVHDEPNLLATDAMDVSERTLLETGNKQVAESAVATKSGVVDFDERPTEKVDEPQMQGLPLIQLATSLTSAASNTDLGEAPCSRIPSPSNSDVATDSSSSRHPGFPDRNEEMLRPRPVPAFRISKPTHVRLSSKPELKKITLERVKRALFSLGCEAHGRRGFERVFSQYWSSFSIVLHGAGLLASTLRQHRAIVDSFLKTRKLRKLHNKLVIGLLDLFYASSPESQDDGNGSNDRSMSMSGASHSSESHEVDADSTGPARTIPQVELQTTPPFSTFVSDPNSTSNMYRSYPATSSFSIPGAMAIDPYVRGVASAAGMRVAENAIWLLVTAMKEFAQTALRNCVQQKIAVKSGELPPTPLIRQRVVHRKRDIGNHSSENDDAMFSNADSASKCCITAMDVFSLTASMSIGGARSIAGTVSRPAFEKALLSSYAGSIEPRPDGFDGLKDFIVTKISPSLAAKVTYDGASPAQPVDASGIVTSSTVPRASSKPSSHPRQNQGGGGLGRGAKDLGALRARSITQRSASTAAVVATSVASVVTTTTTTDSSQSARSSAHNQGQGLTLAPGVVAQSVQRVSVAQADPTPHSQSLESVRNAALPPSSGLQPERMPSPEPKPQSANLARRGKGFGVKNLAAMRARSITKPADAEEGKAPKDTPAVAESELRSMNSDGTVSIPTENTLLPLTASLPTSLNDDTHRPLEDTIGSTFPSTHDTAGGTRTTDDTRTPSEAEIPKPSTTATAHPSAVEEHSPPKADGARSPSIGELRVSSAADEAPVGLSTNDASIPSTDVVPAPSTEHETPSQSDVDTFSSLVSGRGPAESESSSLAEPKLDPPQA